MKKTFLLAASMIATIMISLSCKKEDGIVSHSPLPVNSSITDTPYLQTNPDRSDTPYLPVAQPYADTPYLNK